MSEVATTQKPQHPVVAFKQNLKRLIDAKELALPSNVTPEAFKNAAIVAVQDNPAILQCKPESVMKSIRTIAAAGLVPDGREAAIVPFGKEAQAMPMVFGLIKSARRSGDVSDIRAHIVYQAELDQGLFDYVVGDEEKLEHKPILFGEKGAAVAAYAIAKLKDGTIVREFMSKDEIEKVRRSSPQQKGSNEPKGIWALWEPEMWKKTVIRRLCKRLDLSAEDLRHIMVEQDQVQLKDVTPEKDEHKTLSQRLQEEPAKDEAPIEGEILEPEKPHWTDEINTSEAFPGDDSFTEGAKAYQDGADRKDCPYRNNDPAAPHWLGGWDEAKKAAVAE